MNKIRISKSVYESMKGIYEQGYSKEMFLEAVMCNRSKLVAEKGTHLYLFVKETRYYNAFEIVDIIKGFYDVECSKEEKVKEVYRKNNEVIRKTFFGNDIYIALGFNQGVEFMNELYNINIKLEGN